MNETTVVNVFETDQYIYIGRPGHGQDGYFGNDHPIGYCQKCKVIHNRETCIKAYKVDFWNRVNQDAKFRKRVMQLQGQRLGCFCHSDRHPERSKQCHGDIIKAWLDAGCPILNGDGEIVPAQATTVLVGQQGQRVMNCYRCNNSQFKNTFGNICPSDPNVKCQMDNKVEHFDK